MINLKPDELQLLREAFPLHPVWLGSRLKLRDLNELDLPRLFEILGNDDEMSWTRKPWQLENVAYLLQLRLRHYGDFGFGIYGVEYDGRLIGMSGLQYWEELRGFEFVSYITREFWRSGISTIIGQWVVEQARSFTSLTEIFAATRDDNPAAIALAKKLGFTAFANGEHFGSLATYWKLELIR